MHQRTNARPGWSAAEEAQLLLLASQGHHPDIIARALGRAPEDVQEQARLMDVRFAIANASLPA
jgi:hypothetical protein